MLGVLVPLGHTHGQRDLLLRGQQGHLADLLEVHAHRVVGGEGVHQRVGIGDLLLGDFLDVGQILHLGQHVVDGRQRVLAADVDVHAVLLERLVELADRLPVQVQILQHRELLGGEAPDLLALFEQLLQRLLRALVRLLGLLLLGGLALGFGQLQLGLGGDVRHGGLLQQLVGHALQFFFGEVQFVVHCLIPCTLSFL